MPVKNRNTNDDMNPLIRLSPYTPSDLLRESERELRQLGLEAERQQVENLREAVEFLEEEHQRIDLLREKVLALVEEMRDFIPDEGEGASASRVREWAFDLEKACA